MSASIRIVGSVLVAACLLLPATEARADDMIGMRRAAAALAPACLQDPAAAASEEALHACVLKEMARQRQARQPQCSELENGVLICVR